MTSPRTVLVTGCSSGIGAHCARALKAEGWRVFATARKPEDIAALAADGLEALHLDYADEASIHGCLENVLAATGGRLDALFNNGGYSQVGAVEDMPTSALRAQFDANFFGWHTLTRAVVAVMRKQGHGRIVHNSSVFGQVPAKQRGAYVASKHALEGLMLSLRQELRGTGIHVCLIEPGPIRSKIATNALAHFKANIDWENSPHAEDYRQQLARLEQGGNSGGGKLGPEAVQDALRRALNDAAPKPHYPVTTPTKLAFAAKRILPAAWLYTMLERYR